MNSNRAIPAKLFIGILKMKDVQLKDRLETRLTSDFGTSDHRMILVPSDNTIHRVFLSFDRLIEPENLPKIRNQCESIETEYSAKLVAGYVDNRHAVIGTAVGTEDVIRFKDGGIQFPDYLAGMSPEFFLSVRKTYRAQLRSMCLLRSEGTP